MIQVTFYTTSGCHLCEDVAKMLAHLADQQICRWIAVDIAKDDCLVDRYGIRIPVVATEEGRELGWPFSLEALDDWLSQSVSG